ncbi:hypothetical protein [Amedibacillus sp. YH-ame10]
MNKEKLIENIKHHKKKISIVMIVLLLIGGGSIYALSNNGDSATPKNAKQSEIKKDEDKSSNNKKSDDTKSDEKSNDDNTTSSDSGDTKKDTKSNSTSTSDNDDKKSSNESSSTDKPSNGGSSSSNDNTSKPNTPSHEHSWVEQTKQEWVAPITKNEQYVIKDAWTEQKPIMEMREHVYCTDCRIDMTFMSNSDMFAHSRNHIKNGESGGSYSNWVNEQVGTETINHPAEYGTRSVTVQDGYHKTVVTGHKCRGCGKTK